LYDCHIDVESCASVKAVKYINKYIYKGHDAANLVIDQKQQNLETLEYDEITTYVESRYLSSAEACFRLFKFKLHGKSHSVFRLQIHMPFEQSILFKRHEVLVALADATNKPSMLIEYF
jgi:hypothetical protein